MGRRAVGLLGAGGGRVPSRVRVPCSPGLFGPRMRRPLLCLFRGSCSATVPTHRVPWGLAQPSGCAGWEALARGARLDVSSRVPGCCARRLVGVRGRVSEGQPLKTVPCSAGCGATLLVSPGARGGWETATVHAQACTPRTLAWREALGPRGGAEPSTEASIFLSLLGRVALSGEARR